MKNAIMEAFKVNVNEKFDFIPAAEEVEALDFVVEGEGRYHVLVGGKAFKAKLLDVNYEEKQFRFEVNGNPYDVAVSDAFDQMVKQMGLTNVQSAKANAIKAPMPGLVLEVSVKIGDTIAKGDSVCILEAMKMENVIKAMGEGVVKAIHVEKGAAVDKGQLMIEIT